VRRCRLRDSGRLRLPYTSRNGAGDLTITWVRRTRYSGEWRDLVDVPLNEASEGYEIDVLDGAGQMVRNLVASSTAANTATSTAWSIFRFGWGFSMSQDFNGDIALIACFAASWTPAMIRRWNADPFGFLRPWGEVPALMGSAPPAMPPSTGGGVVVCIME
jgi:hypothetical protein